MRAFTSTTDAVDTCLTRRDAVPRHDNTMSCQFHSCRLRTLQPPSFHNATDNALVFLPVLAATAQHSTFILKPQRSGRPSTKVRLGPRTGFFSSAATGTIATIAAVRRWRWQSDLIMRLESRRGTRDTHIPLRQPESWAGTTSPSLAKVCCSAATSAHYGATNRMLDYILARCRRRQKDFFPASRVSDHALGLATGLSPRSAASSKCVATI